MKSVSTAMSKILIEFRKRIKGVEIESIEHYKDVVCPKNYFYFNIVYVGNLTGQKWTMEVVIDNINDISFGTSRKTY